MYFRFSIAVGALYVRNHFKVETREAVADLVEHIQNVFIDVIQAVSWMDRETRERAIDKARALKVHVGYQNELEEWLLSQEDEYKELEIEPNDLLANILRMGIYDNDYLFSLLHEPIYRNESNTLLNPAEVLAQYVFTENAIR